MSKLRAKNSERIIIAQININGIERKFQSLVSMIKDKVDIIMISETKVDDAFPYSQFEIAGYSSPFRLDRNSYGGGIMLFFPDYLQCRKLDLLRLPNVYRNESKKKYISHRGMLQSQKGENILLLKSY